MAKISNLIAYPTVAPQLADYVIGTDTSNSNETVNFTLQSIADVMPATIGGSGTLNRIAMFTPDGLTIGDSKLSQSLPLSSGLYQMRFDDCDRFIINKPSSVTTGDPEYLIQQDGDFKVSFGWDDDGAGFGFIYNWAGNGLRLGAAGQNPQFELNTTVPKIISHSTHEFEAQIIDRLGNVGLSGQVLSATATGVQWIDQLPSGLSFQGSWDANANNPALASGVGVQGYYYIVGTPGTTNLDGNNSWQTGDWAIFNGTAWQEIDNQNIFSGTGTANTLTKWTGTQSLGNSSITDDGTSVVVANDTYLQGSTIHIGNDPTDSAVVNGIMTFQQNARFNSTMQDAGGQPGTSGQVLSSTGTSVLWKSVVDGSGSANKIPKWLDSDTLTDSAISDVAGAVSISASSFTSTLSANVEITSTTGPITLSAFGDVNIDSQTTTHINRNNLTSDVGLWGPAVFENSAYFKSTIKDSTNAVGTAGQVLSSTGTATQWINNPSSTISPTGSRYVSGVVTSAELLALAGTPKVLVPAPGAGKLIVIDMLSYFYDFNTTPYSVTGSPGLYFAGNVATSGRYIAIGSAVWTATSDYRAVSIDTFFSELRVDDALVLGTTGTLTGGDSVFYYYLSYKILNAADMSPVLS